MRLLSLESISLSNEIVQEILVDTTLTDLPQSILFVLLVVLQMIDELVVVANNTVVKVNKVLVFSMFLSISISNAVLVSIFSTMMGPARFALMC